MRPHVFLVGLFSCNVSWSDQPRSRPEKSTHALSSFLESNWIYIALPTLGIEHYPWIGINDHCKAFNVFYSPVIFVHYPGYYLICFLVYWTAAGYGYLISIVVPPSMAQLFAVLSVLFNMMFSGALPRFEQLQKILGGVLYYPTFISYIRWSQEAFYLHEIREYDGLYDGTYSLLGKTWSNLCYLEPLSHFFSVNRLFQQLLSSFKEILRIRSVPNASCKAHSNKSTGVYIVQG